MREWQESVGKAWAESWKLTDRSFTGLTGQFLGTIASLSGNRILDIGCGAGEISLALARQRHDAEVLGVDISPDLIGTARQRAADNPRLRFIEADAATWQGNEFEPDLLVSRHGVMFFDDPQAAFANLHAIAATRARLAFTCFRSPEENPWASALRRMLPKSNLPPPPHAPGPFAFSDAERVHQLIEAAGWHGIRIEPLDFAYIAGAGADPVADAVAFFQRIGPAAPALGSLVGNERSVLLDRLTDWAANNLHDGLVVFPAAAWQITARKG